MQFEGPALIASRFMDPDRSAEQFGPKYSDATIALTCRELVRHLMQLRA
jgi:hypothetical protein